MLNDRQLIYGLKVGDQVRFKKPKKNPIWGTVVGIVDDVRGTVRGLNQVVFL